MLIFAVSKAESGGIGTAVIVLLLIVVCVFAVRSYCKKLTKGCCGTGGDSVKKIRPSDKDAAHYPYRYHIEIDGMSCNHCVVRVENAFHEREGFLAEADLRGGCAEVRAKRAVSDGELREIVRGAGYMPLKITEPAEG